MIMKFCEALRLGTINKILVMICFLMMIWEYYFFACLQYVKQC